MKEPLDSLLAIAERNSTETRKNFPVITQLLEDINGTMQDANGTLVNSPDWFLVLFLGRAHSAFIAAVRLALSGETTESYMVQRGALEDGMYALHIKSDPEELERVKVWLERNDSDKSKHAVIGEFKMGNLRASITREDPKLTPIINTLYDRCVDLGAHPNKLGLLTSAAWSKNEDGVPTFQVFAFSHTQDALLLALKTCTEVGIAVLRLFACVYHTRFELAGLLQRIHGLENRVEPTFRQFYARSG